MYDTKELSDRIFELESKLLDFNTALRLLNREVDFLRDKIDSNVIELRSEVARNNSMDVIDGVA